MFFLGRLPEDFVVLALIAAVVRLVTTMYVRQQIRANPAREQALQEDVRYRSIISARRRSPNRRLRPGHWYYPRSNPTEVVVHTSTFQISEWSFRRRGRRFGYFLNSAQTTMWQTQMRFSPFGVMPCIVVAGSYPFGGTDRPVEVAMAPRGSLQDLWNALAASGVRAATADGPGGMPGTYSAAPLARTASAAQSTWAPPSVPSAWAQSPGPPPMRQTTGALSYKSGSWQTRRALIIFGAIFLLLPFVASLILHTIGTHQTDTAVSLNGSTDVATVSGAACAIGSGDVSATGTITANADAPTGLRIAVQMKNHLGAPYGTDVTTTTSPLVKGQSTRFAAFVPTSTTSPNASDLCDVAWESAPLA
jgi:hypothetical protein